MLQIISAGEHLTLDMVRAMHNLKEEIRTYRHSIGRRRREGGRGVKREGGFLAFWRSVDATETFKKVPSFKFKTLLPFFF